MLRQRVPLHLSGWEVKKLIAAAGEFLWLPSEYELFHSKRDFLIYGNTSLAEQGVTEETYLYTKIVSE